MEPKPRERKEARRLRANGTTLREIASELGVSLNSAHRWTKDISLTEEQRLANRRGPTGPWGRDVVEARSRAWSKRNRQRRLSEQQAGRERARLREPLHLAGCMLYWAEGAKSRNTFAFANSDPHMMRLISRFLRESMGVPPSDFRLRLNVHLNNGLSLEEIEAHWLVTTSAPRRALGVHTLDHLPSSSKSKRTSRLRYGVCTLRVVRSTWLVQHIYGALQEYAGFDEPRWLDGPPRSRAAQR